MPALSTIKRGKQKMEGFPMEGLIAVGLGILFLLLVSTIRIVSDYERLVILFLGRYAGTRGPGITFVLPFLERAFKTDLREKFLDIPAQTAITRDNASILVDFLVYYRITEPMLSVLKVEDVERASINIATTTLRAVIGDIELDSALSERERINDELRSKLDEATERWGLKVTAVEIREIEPPRDILDAMNRQMSAERDRRAAILKSQGQRESAILEAEGQKQSAILKAQGQREAAVLEAEGQRQAQLLKAQGYAAALEAIYEKAQHLDDNTMMLQYLDMLQELGKGEGSTFILPMELTGLAEKVAKSTGMMNGSKA
jgi:regulator of protease activity HflC (stomatin/prohibitin superfamily)